VLAMLALLRSSHPPTLRTAAIGPKVGTEKQAQSIRTEKCEFVVAPPAGA